MKGKGTGSEKGGQVKNGQVDKRQHQKAEYDFDRTIREYLRQGREKLIKDLTGTREAIKLIANDKARDFMLVTDRGLNKEERDYLVEIIISSMCQTFCYGYGIGKIEGKTNSRVYL